jgi:hypothetical protein
MKFTPNPSFIFQNEKIKFIRIKESPYYNEWERKIFFELKPRCALLPSVVGAYNKGYTVRPSARASPKFFFRYATEKLRISQTLYEITFLSVEVLMVSVLNTAKIWFFYLFKRGKAEFLHYRSGDFKIS